LYRTRCTCTQSPTRKTTTFLRSVCCDTLSSSEQRHWIDKGFNTRSETEISSATFLSDGEAGGLITRISILKYQYKKGLHPPMTWLSPGSSSSRTRLASLSASRLSRLWIRWIRIFIPPSSKSSQRSSISTNLR